MLDITKIAGGTKVRIFNPRRNTERQAINRHGDVWEVRHFGDTTSIPSTRGEILIGIMDEDRNRWIDLRWWAIENMEIV